LGGFQVIMYGRFWVITEDVVLTSLGVSVPQGRNGDTQV
jgi:hypothetical protein